MIGRAIAVGEGLAGRAIRDRSIVVDARLEVEQFPASIRATGVEPFEHGIGLPLIRDGVVIGAFTVGRTGEGSEPFSDLEIEGVQLLAGNAALAIAECLPAR